MVGNVSTRIELFSNLSYPLDNSHVRRFDSLTNQNAFFTSKEKAWIGEDFKYTRVENYTFQLKIKGKVIDTQKLGYARIKNLFDSDKWYYCFINKVNYTDDLTIELELTLDFYQTYCFDMNILPSYVERHHTRLYNSDGLPVQNTVDEGLDYGKQYRTVSNTELKYSKLFFLVIVSTKPLGETDENFSYKYVGSPTPLNYYIIPYSLKDPDKLIDIRNDGRTIKTLTLESLFATLQGDKDVVNSVVSMYTTLWTGLDFNSVYDENANLIDMDSLQAESRKKVGTYVFKATDGIESYILKTRYVELFRELNVGNVNKYSGVPNYTESKLKISPYTIVNLLDYKGNIIDIEPEYVNGSNLDIFLRGSIGSQNKLAYFCKSYLPNVNNTGDDTGYLNALVDNSPNNIPILTDALADYMQGNINSINNKKTMSERNRNLEIATGALSTIPSLFTGPIGAGYGLSSFASNTLNAENRNYNDVKTLQAKEKDISNVPPSANNMGGDTQYEWGNDFKFPRVVIKTVTAEYAKRLSDYFGMYGYQVNELVQPNVNTRTKWNYVKCTTVNIQSGMNREIILKFKEIFEKGVTFWHDDDMFNYNRNNEVK